MLRVRVIPLGVLWQSYIYISPSTLHTIPTGELNTMNNTSNRRDSEKKDDNEQNGEDSDQCGDQSRTNQASPNQSVRRLPNGEIPTAKNTLRSFESSSYSHQVTTANAIAHTAGKPSGEAIGTIVDETVLEGSEFTVSNDDPVVDAVAAPVLEEAEAILFEEDPIPRQEITSIPNGNDETTSSTPKSQPPRRHNKRVKWILVVALSVIVAGIVAGVLSFACMDGECRSSNADGNKSENEKENVPSPTSVVGIPLPPTIVAGNSTSPAAIPVTSETSPSTSPSSIDSTARANTFVDFINLFSLAEGPIINAKNGTPEDIALNWLITSDPWFRTSYLQTSSERFRIRQRYALLTLFFQQQQATSTTDVEPSSWKNISGWLDDEEECNWHGITCTPIDFGDGSGALMAVTSMNLQQQNISGTLPPDLGLLTSMENFEIYENDLYGTIPDSFNKWTNLTTFYVFHNKITGTVPFSVGQWSKLQQVSFAFNRMTGTLPSSIARWTNLDYFGAYGNQFNGSIPDGVGQWKNMLYFNIHRNSFSGSLPTSIGQLTELQTFNILDNRIIGSIPESISQWPRTFKSLSLAHNLMTGTLPSTMGLFTDLWYFDVAYNSFTGSIPAFVSIWSPRLKYFAMDHNNFTGLIPEEFCNVTTSPVIQADCNEEVTCDCCKICF